MIKFIFVLLFLIPATSLSQSKTIGEVIIDDNPNKEVIEIVGAKAYDLSEKKNVALISKPGSKYDAIIIYLRSDREGGYDLTLAAMLNAGFYFKMKIRPNDLNLVAESFHTILEVNAKDVRLSLMPQKDYFPLNKYICPMEKRRTLWLFGKTEYRPADCL